MTGRSIWIAGVLSLAASLALTAPALGAQTLAVDDDGFGTPADCGAPVATFTTVQAAVTAAAAGDTIRVCPGTYAGRTEILKSVSLVGAQAGVDASDPSRTGLPATESVLTGTGNNGLTALVLNENNVTVDGFTVEGSINDLNEGAGIVLGAGIEGAHVTNSIVQNNRAGLFLANDSAANPAVVRRNVFRSNDEGNGVAAGIYSDEFVAGGLVGAEITDNSFANEIGTGISLLPASTAPQSGISIARNSLTQSGNAIVLANAANSSITDNTILGSTGSQVAIGGNVTNTTISGNRIANGAARGVRVFNAGGNVPSSSLAVTCNLITGNPTSALTVEAGTYTGSLNAELNWWGSATGPTIASNPGGTGGLIVDPGIQVDYTPFLLNDINSNPSAPGFGCPPTASVANVTVPESAGSASVPVTLNKPHAVPVSLAYATANGSASAPADFTATSGTLTLPAGQTTGTIAIPIANDSDRGTEESFGLTISAPVNATIAKGAATITIQDTTGPNRAPEAKGDKFTVKAGSKLKVKAPGALKGDTDPDGDELTASLESKPKHGKVKIKASGAFTYKPSAGFTGKDSFQYAASDGTESATAKVKLKVKEKG